MLAKSGTGELLSDEREKDWLTMAVTEGARPDGSLPESARSSRWEAACPVDFPAEETAYGWRMIHDQPVQGRQGEPDEGQPCMSSCLAESPLPPSCPISAITSQVHRWTVSSMGSGLSGAG